MTSSHPLTDVILPDRLVCHFQPYGTEVLGQLQLKIHSDNCNGSPRTLYGVAGIVIEGSETSRIGAHRSTRDTRGTPRMVWGVTVEEIARGELTRAHCG